MARMGINQVLGIELRACRETAGPSGLTLATVEAMAKAKGWDDLTAGVISNRERGVNLESDDVERLACLYGLDYGTVMMAAWAKRCGTVAGTAAAPTPPAERPYRLDDGMLRNPSLTVPVLKKNGGEWDIPGEVVTVDPATYRGWLALGETDVSAMRAAIGAYLAGHPAT